MKQKYLVENPPKMWWNFCEIFSENNCRVGEGVGRKMVELQWKNVQFSEKNSGVAAEKWLV